MRKIDVINLNLLPIKQFHIFYEMVIMHYEDLEQYEICKVLSEIPFDDTLKKTIAINRYWKSEFSSWFDELNKDLYFDLNQEN